MQQNDDLLDLPELENPQDDLLDLPELETPKNSFLSSFAKAKLPMINVARPEIDAVDLSMEEKPVGVSPIDLTTAAQFVPYAGGVGKAAEQYLKQEPFNVKEIAKAQGYSMPQTAAPLFLGEMGLKAMGEEKLTPLEIGLTAASALDLPIRGFSKYAAKSKPEVEKIQQAAKELGVEATPGMTVKGKTAGKIESYLEQTPFGGAESKKKLENYQETAKKTAKEITEGANSQSEYELSEQMKKNIAESIEKELAPAEGKYLLLENTLKEAPADVESIQNTINILRETHGVDEGANRILNAVEKSLNKIKNVNDIKTQRTTIGKMYKGDMSKNEFDVLNGLYEGFTNARSSSLLKEAKTSLNPDEFIHAAKELESADSLYKNAIGRISESFGLTGKGGIKGQSEKMIKNIPSTEIARKIFDVKEINQLRRLKEVSPAAFETGRIQKVNDILKKSTKTIEGEEIINATTLIKEIDALPREAKELIFTPDKLKKFEALKTLHQAKPVKLGPSGTDQAKEVGSMFNVLELLNLPQRLAALIKYKYLKNIEKSAKLRDKLGNKLIKYERDIKPGVAQTLRAYKAMRGDKNE